MFVTKKHCIYLICLCFCTKFKITCQIVQKPRQIKYTMSLLLVSHETGSFFYSLHLHVKLMSKCLQFYRANCGQFMYLVISLLVLRVGYGIWLYQFLIRRKKKVVFTVTCPKNWVSRSGFVFFFFFTFFFNPNLLCLVVIMLQKRNFIAIISVCR